jgi:AraC family L-rhamnose operon regulatory protein RhaS
MKSKKQRGRQPGPVYQEAGKTYLADNCRPLIEAAKAGGVTLHALGRAGYPGRRLGADRLPGLCSAGCWNAGPNQKWGLPLHRNEGIEISFLASGRTPINIDGRPGVLSHDEFMITRPWQPHQIGDPHIGACKLVWLIIDVGVRRPHQAWQWPDWVVLDRADLEKLTRFLRQNEQFIWPGSGEIRRCFLSLAQALETDAAGGGLSRVAVRINELLLALLSIFQEQRILLRKTLTSAERTVRLFLRELSASLDHPWTLESMAESCHLGVTRFVHYFRGQTNLTPANYLNHARILKACGMLASQPDISITEVGFACGFSSSQYFTNVFRKQTGCPPREYRARVGGMTNAKCRMTKE